jgi:ECF sigma factor
MVGSPDLDRPVIPGVEPTARLFPCRAGKGAILPSAPLSLFGLAEAVQRPSADVTRILVAAASGDPKAAAELLPHVYGELRGLAADRMAAERPCHTLDATALVHEAYLRLVGRTRASRGPAAGTSSPPRRRPCAASWSRAPAASDGCAAAGTGSGSIWTAWTSRPPSRTTICSPWTRLSPDSPRPDRARQSAMHEADPRTGGRAPGTDRPDGQLHRSAARGTKVGSLPPTSSIRSCSRPKTPSGTCPFCSTTSVVSAASDNRGHREKNRAAARSAVQFDGLAARKIVS